MKKIIATIIALMTVLSTVSFAAPTMVSTVTTAQETQTQENNVPEDSAELNADTVDWIDDKYGHLVYKLDFETSNKFVMGKTNAQMYKHGVVNPKYELNEKWWINPTGFGTIEKVTENGNTFLRTRNSTGQNSQFMLESDLVAATGDLTTFTGENGYYTFFYDYRLNITGNAGANFTKITCQDMFRYYDGTQYLIVTMNAPDILGTNITNNQWYTSEHTQYTKTYGSYAIDSLSRYRPIFNYSKAPTTADADTFDIDNVMLYFKPFSVDFTVVGNEYVNDVVLNIDIPADTLNSVYTKSELLALVNAKSGVKCLDLTLEDGSSFEKIDIVEINKVKGVFKTYQINHPDYGTLLYDIDFENENALTNDQNMALQGFVNTSFKGSENWKVGFAQVASAIKVAENGNTFVRMKNNKNQHPQFQTMAVSRSAGVFTEENGYFTVMVDVRANLTGNAGRDIDQFFSQNIFQHPDKSNGMDTISDRNLILAKDIPSDKFVTKTETILSNGADSLRRINYAFRYKGGNPETEDADTFDVDNLKVYFKPNKVAIKILGDESLSIADKTIDFATPDVSYVVSKKDLINAIDLDDYTVIDDLVLADGSSFETIDLDDVTSFKAVYRKYETYDETYGHVVFNLDFEISEAFKERDKMALHGMVNSNYSSSANWWINNSNCGTMAIASDENGNSFLRVGNATAANSQVMFESGTAQLTGDLSTFVGENGYYTYSYDIRPNTDVVSYITNQSFYRHKDGDSWNQKNVAFDAKPAAINDWSKVEVKLNNKTSGTTTLDSLYRFRPVVCYKETPTAADLFTFDIDNVVLYFKPFSTEVTVLAGDNADFEAQKVNIEIGSDLNSTITKASLMSLVKNDTNMILSDLVLADGSAFESIDVAKVSQVKAVWMTRAPKSYNVSSIRTSEPAGIRFRASVTSQQKSLAQEYGFIVTLEKHLGENDATALTMDSGIKKVTGVSYGYDPIAGKNVDRIFEIEDNNIFFTAAIYGMPATKEAYSETVVVRPYLKDADGTYYYAVPVVRSIIDIAIAVRDSGYADVDMYGRMYVESILTVCGENI